LHICQDLGLTLMEKRITRHEAYICNEAFFNGTAAKVTPMRELDRIELGAADVVGPGIVCCPDQRMPLWGNHPKVFIDVSATCEGRQPYSARAID
jgi:uncharacterized Zn-finger protein